MHSVFNSDHKFTLRKKELVLKRILMASKGPFYVSRGQRQTN